MEALVTIVVELVLICVAPVLAVVGAIAAAVADAIGGLIGVGAAAGAAKKRRRPKWVHGLLLAPIVVVLIAVVVAELFYVDRIARAALDRVAARAGYDLDYTLGNGSLVAGKLALSDVRVANPQAAGQRFEFTVDDLSVDVDLWSVLLRPLTLTELEIAGVRGTITKAAGAGETAGRKAPRARFRIDRFALSDAVIEVAEPGGAAQVIEIDSARSEPFRSYAAVFDVFFRSNLTARLNGAEMEVRTARQSDRGRSTRISLRDVPVATVEGLVDRAPITWLSGGTVSAEITDDWRLDQETRIDMDWRVTLDDVTVTAPEDASLASRLLATAIGEAVNGETEPVELAFTVEQDADGFDSSSTQTVDVVWAGVMAGLAQTWAEDQGISIDEADEDIDKIRQGIRGLLSRSREGAE